MMLCHSPNLVEHDVTDTTIRCLDVEEAEAIVCNRLCYSVNMRYVAHDVKMFLSQ